MVKLMPEVQMRGERIGLGDHACTKVQILTAPEAIGAPCMVDPQD